MIVSGWWLVVVILPAALLEKKVSLWLPLSRKLQTVGSFSLMLADPEQQIDRSVKR